MNTGKAISHNVKQLIIGIKVYKNKNIVLGFSLTFPSNFSYVFSSHLSFFMSLLIDYFAMNKNWMNEWSSQ